MQIKQRSYSGEYMQEGKKGEEVVIGWLQNNCNVIGVSDLRSLRQMREADVDLSVSLMDGRVTLAEIKSDKHLGVSGNVLFETLRINHTSYPEKCGTLGWSLRSPAKWLLYYAPSVNRIYTITFVDFRRGFQKHTKERRSYTRVNWVNTDNIKSTVNVLIPEKYFPNMKIFELGE